MLVAAGGALVFGSCVRTPESGESLSLECGLFMVAPADSVAMVGPCEIRLVEGVQPSEEQRASMKAAKQGPDASPLAGITVGPRGPWKLNLSMAHDSPGLECIPRLHVLSSGRLAWSCGFQDIGGGSGGTEYEREGWMRIGRDAYVVFKFKAQQEWPGKPSEAVLWAVLDSLKFREGE